MNSLIAWFRQPSTLMAVGVGVAGAVYWFTKSPELAMISAAAILGTVSDSTAALIAKVESIENIVADIAVPPAVTLPDVTHTSTIGDVSVSTSGSAAAVLRVIEATVSPTAKPVVAALAAVVAATEAPRAP